MRRRWGFGLLIILICLAGSCRRQFQDGTAPAAGAQPEAFADSLEQLGHPIEFDELTDSENVRTAELEARLNENGQERSGHMPVPLGRVTAQTIWGARSDIRGRIGLFDRFEAGYRTDRTRRSAFITMSRWGPVGFAAAGNVRATFGEGLVLGSRDPAASPLASGTRRGDLLIRPSLSLWEQTRGLAAGLQIGQPGLPGLEALLKTGVLMWARYEPSSKVWQREGWLTTSLTWKQWWWGAAVGFPMASGCDMDPAGCLLPRALTVAVKKELSGGSAGPTSGGRTGLSAEVARLGQDVFFVLGGSGRARYRSRWHCRFFKQPAPRGYGGSANGLLTVLKTMTGGSCRLAGRMKGLNTSLHIYDGLVRSNTEMTHYRRIYVSIGGRPFSRRHRLKSVLSYYEKRQTRASLFFLIPESRYSAWTEGRFGLQWDDDPTSFITHRLRTDCRVDDRFRLVGVLLSVSARLRFQSGEAEWRVTNYSLEPGRSGYVSRPGIGTFEYLSVVYKDGSDISLRIKFRLRPAFELIGYYGRPWGREPRFYIGGCLAGE
jgi:hypothetical protein